MNASSIRLARLPAPLRAAFPWVVPVATTALTVAVQRVLLPQPALAPFALSFAGVALAAWLAGRTAGIFATVLSAMAANYLFVAPQGAWSLSRPALTATGIFLASAFTVALLAGSLREAIGRAERAAALLRASEEALREADRRKDEFLAMLAHELRNPFAAISGAARALRVRFAGATGAERPLAILERQTRQGARLLDDLLDVSRITRGTLELQVAPTDLRDVVRHAVDAQRAAFEAAGHRLAVTLPDAPAVVAGDAARLEQIVSNLLSNAAKYTPRGGHVEVVVEGAEDRLLLRVRDDGSGIAPELLPQVFDPFVQAERSLARTQGGLGLGLTLVRTLAELHGGSAEATSAGLGRGSEFVVSLPAAPDASVPAARGAASTAGAAAAAPRAAAGSRRVLVVDDNEDAAEVLSDFLRAAGHEVTVAHDGVAGLEEAGRFAPDVVLLDIGLPGMDGYEVARRLRAAADAPGPLLVAVSGYGRAEDRARSQEAGFAIHLTKPVDLETLARVVSGAPREATPLPVADRSASPP